MKYQIDLIPLVITISYKDMLFVIGDSKTLIPKGQVNNYILVLERVANNYLGQKIANNPSISIIEDISNNK